eukprot:CAMPEP_0179181566 /NCGR_PEP_ID=MMETSP0796-20121207/89929_1 /TAXON_ID=73915 /ORGANISM="Pyrodinium bahamense, Strain pbaha01" /LENGTH=76 /DNA_ID=CAMNT_0020885347 /DNA_START=26 /DNA_END=252 /DNA_ORIENTATION=-
MRRGVWFALAAVAPCACGASMATAIAAESLQDRRLCSATEETEGAAMLQWQQRVVSGILPSQVDDAEAASLISVWP